MYLGDVALGATIDFKFTTRAFASGVPTTLAGSPAVAAYVNNGTTEITAGITLTVDFDSRTGMHNVRAVLSGANGYAAADNIAFALTAGTVGGTSVVGEVIAHASIEARSALRPTTAGRTISVDTNGKVAIQSGLPRNVAITDFPFVMTDSTNHNPAPGLTVTGQYSHNGGNSYSSAGTVTEATAADGGYHIDLSSTVMNNPFVLLKFTASGADTLFIALATDA